MSRNSLRLESVNKFGVFGNCDVVHVGPYFHAIDERDQLLITRDIGSIIREIQGSGDIGL